MDSGYAISENQLGEEDGATARHTLFVQPFHFHSEPLQDFLQISCSEVAMTQNIMLFLSKTLDNERRKTTDRGHR